MSELNIELSKLMWEIIRDIALASWFATPVFIKYIKPWWQNRIYLNLTPSRQGAKQLRRLAKTLGRMRFWIKYDNEMGRRIGRSLFQAENDILTESFSYFAVHSENDEERCSALMYLSQLKGQEMMRYAEGTINAVLNDRCASDKVKNVALAALKELNVRRNRDKEISLSSHHPNISGDKN